MHYCIKPVVQSLVVALILTHLDYGNVPLAGFADQSLVELRQFLTLLLVDLQYAQVRSRDAASTWATLAVFFREDRLQFSSADLQVPQWSGTVVSRLRISSCGWHAESTASALGVNSGSYHPMSPLCSQRRSRFFSRSCVCTEHSCITCDVIVEFGCFQVSLENRVVHAMLQCWLTSIHLAHLPRDFINYVTCPWSLLTLRHR